MKLEIPIPDDLKVELVELWDRALGPITDISNRGLFGQEIEENRNTLYLERRGGKVAGTCLMTTSNAMPTIGIFGHVATDPAARRSGIATGLCRQAVDDFRSDGGEIVFLGTQYENGAARIYHRVGWRFLAGTHTMANVSNGDSPEEFLADYFREQGPPSVRPGSASDRGPMLPLLMWPHDWRVLDSNADPNVYSPRYRTQTTCNGIYPMYEEVRAEGLGEWFAAQTDDGRIVGLATARLSGAGVCRLDGFAHQRHMSAWPLLVSAATSWADGRGAHGCEAVVCVEDEEKQAAFESLGFTRSASSENFTIAGREIGAVKMALA